MGSFMENAIKSNHGERVLVDACVWIDYFVTKFSEIPCLDDDMMEYIDACVREGRILMPYIVENEVSGVLWRKRSVFGRYIDSQWSLDWLFRKCRYIEAKSYDRDSDEYVYRRVPLPELTKRSINDVKDMYMGIRTLKEDPDGNGEHRGTCKKLLASRDAWAYKKYCKKWSELSEETRKNSPPASKNGQTDMEILAYAREIVRSKTLYKQTDNASESRGNIEKNGIIFLTADMDFTAFSDYIYEKLSIKIVDSKKKDSIVQILG